MRGVCSELSSTGARLGAREAREAAEKLIKESAGLTSQAFVLIAEA
jgi:hypothetical protein